MEGETNMDLFDAIIFGGRLMEWLIAVIAATLVFLILLVVKRFVVRRFKTPAKKTATDVDDFLVDLWRSTTSASISQRSWRGWASAVLR